MKLAICRQCNSRGYFARLSRKKDKQLAAIDSVYNSIFDRAVVKLLTG